MWPDSKLGPLAAKDMRLPYPGHIGLECNLKSTEPTLEELSRDKKILLDDISFWAKLVHQPSRQSEQVQVCGFLRFLWDFTLIHVIFVFLLTFKRLFTSSHFQHIQ